MLPFKNSTLYWIDTVAAMPMVQMQSVSAPDDSCEAFVETLSENKKGSNSDGKYANCSYAIYINMSSVKEDFNPSFVKFAHKHKGETEWFPVQRIEFYDLTKTIEIWV